MTSLLSLCFYNTFNGKKQNWELLYWTIKVWVICWQTPKSQQTHKSCMHTFHPSSVTDIFNYQNLWQYIWQWEYISSIHRVPNHSPMQLFLQFLWFITWHPTPWSLSRSLCCSSLHSSLYCSSFCFSFHSSCLVTTGIYLLVVSYCHIISHCICHHHPYLLVLWHCVMPSVATTKVDDFEKSAIENWIKWIKIWK